MTETRLGLQPDYPTCLRCGADGLFAARIPLNREDEDGEPAAGYLDAVLCEHCDHDDPAAGPVLALFAVDDLIGSENVGLFTELATAWAEGVRSATLAARSPGEALP